uniref:Uncharacterized protein n=1 Tax=Cebus imitator TaxID=2715852 RepID=A0A2K5R639_CEBIM
YGPEAIEAQYEYRTTRVSREGGVLKVHPTTMRFTFRTARQVSRLGVMLVGWDGNNGSTLTAAVLANRLRLSWPTRSGRKEANYYGSLAQVGTVSLGLDAEGQEVFVPFSALLPMVAPNDLVACVGLPPQNHMLLEHKMERPGPSLKQVGPLAATCPVSNKKGPVPASTSGCTGDANGHLQVEEPQMPTT